MATGKQIRVLLVDDHTVVRSGLSALLMANDDFKLIGEAKNGEEAIRLCESLQPDVVLMDLMMPGMGGVNATKVIREKWENINVIALTSFKEKEMVEGALKAGAISYLLKTVTAEELETAIRGAVVGESRLSPEATQVLVQRIKEPKHPEYDLTDREKDILKLMIEGIPNNEIAKRLVVSESTIKFHVSNILSKLSCSSRTEAVAIALKNNLVK
jgi:two-component system, NarL family, response regulator LiaR